MGKGRRERKRTVPSPFHVSVKGLPAVMPLKFAFVKATKAWVECGRRRARRAVVRIGCIVGEGMVGIR